MENDVVHGKIEERIRSANEELQDAISLIIILENDLFTQKSEDVHIRTIKIIHNVIQSAKNTLLEVIKTE
uniref:hypothetical protein n=1 Tax=Acetatifactor sp. TaxID=1872090 RepID=UPI004056535C